MALLRLERHRRDWPSLEPRQRDRLAGHFAITIFALVKTADRAIDLGDQLALAIAGAKLDRPIGLARRAVGNVGLAQGIDLELRHGLARFLDDRFLPRLQLAQKIGPMFRAHEFLAFRRTISLRKDDPIEWSEFFAAIKVDKCSRHEFPSPHKGLQKAHTPPPGCGRPTGAAGGN